MHICNVCGGTPFEMGSKKKFKRKDHIHTAAHQRQLRDSIAAEGDSVAAQQVRGAQKAWKVVHPAPRQLGC